ncbi:developmental pluripotency-associated protein 3 isoform X1 [Canis lupus familiaris]|uniref:developmental pluripotency-associated protein 3 isoform X1 n=1 Tax=Canis lupus familiaris TaxID=9615 RepID=UPI001237058C|nr:developmental pluripotency-associated protein 3 isoform X1 [Canis lupus familiaris]
MKDKLQLPQGKQFGVTAESFEEGAEVPHHKRRSFRSQVFQSYTYAAVQTMSEVLVKNLSKLTLDPSIKLPSPLPDYPPQQQEREKKPQGLVDRILSNNRKRSGVRTLLTARKERMERMIRLIQYQRYLNKRSMLQKDLPEQEIEGESRVERFRCTCHYCLYHKDVSEDTSMENNYDTEPIYPNSFLKLSGHACGFFVLYACVYLSLWSYFPHHLQIKSSFLWSPHHCVPSPNLPGPIKAFI